MLGFQALSISDFFPVITNRFWYVTSYFVFLCLYPFFSRVIANMPQIELKQLIIVLFFLWILPTIIPINWSFGASETSTFFFLYIIIYYLRNYRQDLLTNTKLWIMVILGCCVVALASIIVLDIVGIKYEFVRQYSCYFFRGNYRLLSFLLSIAIFTLFISKVKFSSNFINHIGFLTFGVYLISTHPVIFDLLNKRVFNLTEVINQPYVIPWFFLSILIIFTACCIIEWVRWKAFEFIKILLNRLRNVRETA